MNTTPDSSDRPDVVQLGELSVELLAQARDHHSRRSARTVQSEPSLRVTLIALTLGAELAEHEAPPAATLQVISGQVRLHTEDTAWRLSAGDLIAIPRSRHGLEAISDTTVLLTVALQAARSE
jgi:quercetin dioxygenase-like cupin family protein